MDEFIKFNNQTAGRDKLFRLAQYLSRFVWSTLEKRNGKSDAIIRAKQVDDILGLMRRLLRFGRSVDTIHGAMKVMSSISDDVIRITSALSRISNSCYMVIDNVVCLQKIGVFSPKCLNSAYWDEYSTRFWLYSLLLSLFRDFYELSKIWKESKITSKNTTVHGRKNESAGATSPHTAVVAQGKIILNFSKQHSDIFLDIAKNIGDLFVAFNSLKITKFNTQFVAFMGIISTVIGGFVQINPMLKMVPAL